MNKFFLFLFSLWGLFLLAGCKEMPITQTTVQIATWVKEASTPTIKNLYQDGWYPTLHLSLKDYSTRNDDVSPYKNFASPQDGTFVTLDGNTLYQSTNRKVFIKMIEKDPNLTPEEIVETLPTTQNCAYIMPLIDDENSDNVYTLLATADGNSATCSTTNQEALEIYIFNTTQSWYYYQLNTLDGCAPGPCSVMNLHNLALFVSKN